MLAVTDNGCGMAPEVRAHIFEPFFTTKGMGQGSGLGLAVVHGIVKQAGGHISLESEVGQGTTIRIHLPALAERPPDRTNANAAATGRGSETILLVEDEEAVRQLTVLSLQRFGYKVLAAASGEEALELMTEKPAEIHLLLTDVVMPGMSGRELSEQLKEKQPALKVLYLSGYTDDAIVRHGILQAEVAFLQKPYSPRTLVTKVREVLDSPAGKVTV
jgi:CheY-like chemotaxis protein